ncbi:MAG TPA: PepSY domain-containing protein [Paracoccus solventivorans]|uniref:PepSY domain-containing protein n=1 Tax=Paracoccus solventivorans TaxID=53463 RepID=A0A832PPU4_9RHOB|nr:PepSY domain-containing protein [Paracoccus solventivorans]HHW35287.1 PepSY domain-containing protein [Paracoccus solventivorans]
MRIFPAAAAALTLGLAPVLAIAAPPPADGLKLSQIVAQVETSAGAALAYIDELEWDDDGYWEVKYITTDGRKIEEKLDPRTGAAMPRR